MAVKNTLKHWGTLIDEALRKETTPSAAEAPLPRTPNEPSKPPQAESPLALPPTSLLEEVDVAEADTSLLTAIQSLSNQTAMPLNIHAEIHSLITPNYIQIGSPRVIAPELLHPFETGAKTITLMFLANKKVTPATVHTIHHNYFFVDTPHATLSHKPGERLLILFPVLPGQQYALQARIDEIYTGRLKLRYQDPRYDVRRQLRLATPVLMRLAPPSVVAAIAQGRSRIVRDISVTPSEAPSQQTGHIADRLYQMDTAIVSPHMPLLEQGPALLCTIHDISPGGVCLVLQSEQPPEELLHRVVHLHIPLPTLASTANQTHYMPFVLEPFGVVRNMQTTQAWTLNIRFLKRLPPESGVLFEYLEQQYLAQKTPLS